MSIGKSIPHDSAQEHACGESVFIDDRPLLAGEVFVGIVCSPVAAGQIINIEKNKALSIPGVLAILTAQDLKHNTWGTIKRDQPILVEKEIGYIHEPVALVVVETRDLLTKAKNAVKIHVQEKPAVLDIDQAIKNKIFLYSPEPTVCGDVEKSLKSAPHFLTGDFIIGGQEHFYLETQAAIVYPLEGSQYEIHSSSQHPSEVQHLVAHCLGLSLHQVVCVVKRMGGAFGGKESQAAPIAAYAALAAMKLKRPARLVLGQEEDFQITGKRHPFHNFYEVGFDQNGKILALKMKLYADGGAYTDLSPSILDRAIYHSDGAYYIENVYFEGHVCKTNHHSNTAFRGFGGPQGNMSIENIIEEIAITLKKDAAEIRQLNCYGKTERNITPYGQTLSNNFLPQMMAELLESSDYRQRRKFLKKWNQEHPDRLRGLSMTACKFGIAFTARFLNQGNAMVNIHRDGSIQVSTGATEMGQGVNTKIQQVVADCFSIPITLVRVMTTSTEKNHNTSPTAASSGSDINAGAAQLACQGLKERLIWVAEHSQHETYKITDKEIPSFKSSHIKLDDWVFSEGKISNLPQNKKIHWKDLIELAYKNRISLGEYAHYKTEGLRKKAPFRYFTSGVAASEVEINSDTGELKILRTDILMDIGRAINPGIDYGQITGGFIQGAGWVTTENLCYDTKGTMTSKSATTYKIPNIQDLPRIFNFNVITNNTNTEVVARSKAVGEPPLLLGASVFLAVKNALSYRSDGKVPKLSSPAIPETILQELARYES